MTLHLIKLAVGADSIEAIAGFQARRGHARHGGPYLLTRNHPKRAADILAGAGSIYWVVAGVVQARQRIAGFVPDTREDGSDCTAVVLQGPLVAVAPRRMRAFQGWRYLSAADAPPDLDAGPADTTALPPGLRRELASLCLI
ncbi:hypothetical protein FHR90_000054 [Endobacter medicaginis]|uniref:DUF1489 domain-containing protein n=2 Tax=Endobacter medicaginis TaxID=1181271 RepID=A0A839UPX9_9PROT|nr:DUF1489 domain-containing protein [Endobacter medicaginis]MBB3172248.1 hypothetical protein [Endobacter medicaginis]MCX5474632.1 DUF1489 domain-containing protein [Endobacter medicaginis]